MLALALVASASVAACGDHDEPPVGEQFCQLKPTETFHERIEPLLEPSRVTTCNECHLSGVDLSAFARETPCKTWACLVEQGLVSTSAPEDSKILGWIERANPKSDLITPDVVQAEHDAFRDWIEANAACPDACAGVTCGKPKDGPTCVIPSVNPEPPPTDEDTRGCTDMDIEQAFNDDVYAWRGRCFPCHFDTETKADPLAPRWLSSIGNCATGSAVSLKRVLGLGLINTDDPTQSLLLLKPLSPDNGAGPNGIKHGGGQKFDGTDDPTYQSFLRFILHYQKCQQP